MYYIYCIYWLFIAVSIDSYIESNGVYDRYSYSYVLYCLGYQDIEQGISFYEHMGQSMLVYAWECSIVPCICIWDSPIRVYCIAAAPVL